MSGYEVISKGTYPRSETDCFVSIVQYLFVKQDGRKFLLLKFSNDSAETATGIKLSIRQTGAKGADLGTIVEEAEVKRGAPHAQFVLPEKIALDDDCVSFSVEILSADFGAYTYSLKGERVIVSYGGEKPRRKHGAEEYLSKTKGKKFSVSTRSFKASVFCLVGVITLFLALGITLFQLDTFKETATGFLKNGIEYEFLDADYSESTPVRVSGYRGSPRRLEIPQKIEEHPVTEVAPRALSRCQSLEYLDLGSVTHVGEWAFEHCVALREVKAGNLELIGYSAFVGNTGLAFVDISNAEKTLEIQDYAFMDCDNIERFNIDQFLSYSGINVLFGGSTSIDSLHLKNYNYRSEIYGSPNTIKGLFGYAERKQLSSLTIDYIDVIPREFCMDCISLTSVEFGYLRDSTVGRDAFRGCKSLTSVSFPHPITYVYEYAFADTAISAFDAEKLQTIEYGAFSNCASLSSFPLENNWELTEIEGGAFSGSGLESIYIPAQIESIESELFQNCRNLSTVTFPSNSRVKFIGDSAFASCTKLSSISLPAKLEELGENAFEECSAFTECKLPASLTRIRQGAFSWCTSLRSMVVPENVYFIGFGAFKNCSRLESLSVPYVGETEMGNGYLGFIFGAESSGVSWNCVPVSLGKVTVTKATKVPEKAFFGCPDIEQILLPAATDEIGAYAFAYCTSLKTAPFGENLVKIGERAFYCCEALTSFTLSNKITEIGQFAFAECESLEEVTLPFIGRSRKSSRYFSDIFGGSDSWDNRDIPQSLKKVTLTDETVIPNAAFRYCSMLREITLNEGISEIGEWTFDGCLNLTKINIPASMKQIGIGAFNNCYKLFEVGNFSALKIARGSSENGGIGYYALNVYGPEKAPMKRTEESGYTFAKAEENWYLVGYDEKQEELDLPLGFYDDGAYVSRYRIPSYLFMENYLITRAQIPSAVKEIGEYAFEGCASLLSVSFAEDSPLKEIGQYTFSNCLNLCVVELPAELESIESHAFFNCSSLESITLHKKLSSIGTDAFLSCLNLVEVYNYSALAVEAGSEDYGRVAYYALAVYDSADGGRIREVTVNGLIFKTYGEKWWLIGYTSCPSALTLDSFEYEGKTISSYSVRLGAFQNCYELTALRIGKAVTAIGENAFRYCSNLTEVVFTEDSRITRIENSTFENCLQLTKLVLPTGLDSICNSAFFSCVSLKSVTLPKKLQMISPDAFGECRLLHHVYNLSGLPLKEGNRQYGYVAYYALKVSSSLSDAGLEYAEKDGFYFVLCDGKAYLYDSDDFDGMSRIDLPTSFEAGGKTVDSYIIKEKAFYNRLFSAVFIPSAVSRIDDSAFVWCYHLTSVYYEGTKKEWEKLTETNTSDCALLSCEIKYSTEESEEI